MDGVLQTLRGCVDEENELRYRGVHRADVRGRSGNAARDGRAWDGMKTYCI